MYPIRRPQGPKQGKSGHHVRLNEVDAAVAANAIAMSAQPTPSKHQRVTAQNLVRITAASAGLIGIVNQPMA
jgi:hypothetical protein